MDIDYLKSVSSDEQMEMMLMMDIGKLSEYSSGGSSNTNTDIGMMDLSSGGSIPHVMNDNSHVDVSPFMNFPSNISFSSSPNMDQDNLALPFVPLANSQGWGNDTATTCTNGSAFLTESQMQDSAVTMREMIFQIAAMQPIQIDPEAVKPLKRRNVKISNDPQSVAARHRRERISEKIRILQRLVPGGTKMDTASMLDEAIHYVKFLKNQIQSLESVAANRPVGVGFPVPITSGCSYLPVSAKGYKTQNLQHHADA